MEALWRLHFEAKDVRVGRRVPVQEGRLVVAARLRLAHDVRVEAKVLPNLVLGGGLQDELDGVQRPALQVRVDGLAAWRFFIRAMVDFRNWPSTSSRRSSYSEPNR